MNSTDSSITILGLGAMGSALASAQLAAGRSTAVWNRSYERAEPFAAQGATVLASAREAIETSPLCVVCLVDDDAVRTVLADASPALAGRVLVNLTNGTPAQARALAEWAGQHGAVYLDGGIMAVPAMIGGPASSVFYSGPSDALERHRDALESFGAVRYVGEDPGAAAAWDLALLAGMYGTYAGVLLALALGRGNGISPTELMPALEAWLTAMGTRLPQLAEQVETDQHASGSPLAMQAQGFPNLVVACEEAGVRPDLLLPIGALLGEAVEAGHGSDGISSTVRLLERDDAAV